jgi:hypothetical protein
VLVGANEQSGVLVEPKNFRPPVLWVLKVLTHTKIWFGTAPRSAGNEYIATERNKV